ncbi:MAG: NUDIX hydrolase [Campylobacterales bacterium]|nr:NUDIX hydrolase [Campylobacterales bacterium]
MRVEIDSVRTAPLETPQYVRPLRIHYRQNGQERSWEAVHSFDSVAVLLYHADKQAFLLVKQFRPPVYLSDTDHLFTYELCAGIVDKPHGLEQIALEEIEEECGYCVAIERIEKITSFFTNVGISGAKQHLFFALIDETMRCGKGGGIHTEYIELEWVGIHAARSFVYDESKAKTPGLMFAFYWFFERYGQ